MNELYITRNLATASEISVHQLVGVLSDAAFVCDQTGRILVCSDMVLDFFSLSDKKRVIGSNFQSYIVYDYIDEAYLLLSSVINEPNSRKSGEFQVKKGIKETTRAKITFSSIISKDTTQKYVLVTFRETPVPNAGSALLQRKDLRLARLFETVNNYSEEPVEKTKKLLSQIGETLGATVCSYYRMVNNQMNLVTKWESPFNTGIPPHLCSKQISEYLSVQNEKFTLIRKPLLTAFLDSEPVYQEAFEVKAILGLIIEKNNVVDGILTVVFTFNYSLSDIDKQYIQTISALIENEGFEKSKSASAPELSFRQLIDCFTDQVYVLSVDGIIMEVNRGTSRCYGYEREELIGQKPVILSAEGKNDESLITKMFDKALQGESQKFEWWGRRKNGEIFQNEVIFNKSSYYDRDAVIAIGRDLSEAKKVEQELLRYNKELLESNTGKDKFFSILAHDLKNPFQGLLGFIDLLYEDLDELSNAQIKEYLSNVRNASYHTYALLENLLEWSRIQSGKMPFTPSVFNLHDEINSVISVLDNNATRKEIKLVNEVDPELMVEADRNMIHSVLQNLITNSIKFSNSNGKVVLRGRVPKSNAKSKISTAPGDRQWLEVSISDNGIGIPEEILPKLFKLNGQYSQAGTANEPGTGLGLVLCHEMVQKNGGRIWAESIAGQGATFIFTIPLSK